MVAFIVPILVKRGPLDVEKNVLKSYQMNAFLLFLAIISLGKGHGSSFEQT